MPIKKLCLCFGILLNSLFIGSALASDPVGIYGKITWVEEYEATFKISGKFVQAIGRSYSPAQEGYFYYFCQESQAICDSILSDFKKAIGSDNCVAWGGRRKFNGPLREHRWLPLKQPDAFPLGMGVATLKAASHQCKHFFRPQ